MLNQLAAIILTISAIFGSVEYGFLQQKNASFIETIAPTLQTHCSPCHYGSQSAGGLKLGTVAQMLKGGVHGPAIVPGKANESRLVLMMEGKILPAMPPIPNAKPLDTKAIRAWIDAGAKERAREGET